METVDVLIVGAGQAGIPLVTAFTAVGKKTVLVEEKYAGGTCINFGCTPTKTMIASAGVAQLTRRGQEYGVQGVGSVEVDLLSVRQRKEDVVSSFRGGSQRRIENSGATFLKGQASFRGSKTIAVQLESGGERQFNAETIILNTGGRPRIPDLMGLQDVPFLDSTTIMELDHLPEHLLILGGGYIALEFGQMFRRFGSQVTIIQRGPQLLGREDPDVADALREILEEDGIRVLLNANAVSVSRTEGRISLRVNLADEEQTLEGTHLLAAVGRQPNVERLNLRAAGIEMDRRGFIRVNERLETNARGVFAAGDVNGGPAFTHIAYDDFRILKTNLLEGGSATTRDRLVPYVLFTDPQLGRVGITENEAHQAGLRHQVVKMPMNYVARAIELDQTRGFLKAVVDLDTKQIVGAAFLGVEGGELMSMIEIAMMGRLSYTALQNGIFAHPTLAEGLNNLFSGLP